MNIWGLVDDRTGHRGQVLGVLTKLAQPYVIKNLEYNTLAKLPNGLLGGGLFHLNGQSRSRLREGAAPDLVVAAGRRMVPVLRHIKARYPNVKLAYLMDPKSDYEMFDVIAIPAHDGPPVRDNIVATRAPLHAVTHDVLGASRVHWHEQFRHLPRPWVAVCLGGDTRTIRYDTEDWKALGVHAARLAGESGSVLMTSSRRTPPEALSILKAQMQNDSMVYDFHAGMDNPYLGFLACADAICVTGDSLSMCAEANASGKPVYIYAPRSGLPAKYTTLHQSLFDSGLAEPLNAASSAPFFEPNHQIDDSGAVADAIRAACPALS